MSNQKPKMTTIYTAKSNQIWEGQRFQVGDKISATDYAALPDEKKECFRKIDLDTRPFVDDLLNRVDGLELKVADLENKLKEKK